jgi:hypothetical protein
MYIVALAIIASGLARYLQQPTMRHVELAKNDKSGLPRSAARDC